MTQPPPARPPLPSPLDPLTAAEREAIRQEFREAAAWLDQFMRENGGPWDDLKAEMEGDADHDAA